MGILDKIFTNRRKKENPYHELRNQALLAKPSEIGIEINNENQAYGAVIDMQMGRYIATLVCFMDGTTSLYFENGGGIIGIGQRCDEVAEESRSFLQNSPQVLGSMELTNNTAMPSKNHHSIYMLTSKGIYKSQLDPERIDSANEEMQLLFSMYQQLLSTVRESTEKIK